MVCASSPPSPKKEAAAIQHSVDERGATPWTLNEVGMGACFVQCPPITCALAEYWKEVITPKRNRTNNMIRQLAVIDFTYLFCPIACCTGGRLSQSSGPPFSFPTTRIGVPPRLVSWGPAMSNREIHELRERADHYRAPGRALLCEGEF